MWPALPLGVRRRQACCGVHWVSTRRGHPCVRGAHPHVPPRVRGSYGGAGSGTIHGGRSPLPQPPLAAQRAPVWLPSGVARGAPSPGLHAGHRPASCRGPAGRRAPRPGSLFGRLRLTPSGCGVGKDGDFRPAPTAAQWVWRPRGQRRGGDTHATGASVAQYLELQPFQLQTWSCDLGPQFSTCKMGLAVGLRTLLSTYYVPESGFCPANIYDPGGLHPALGVSCWSQRPVPATRTASQAGRQLLPSKARAEKTRVRAPVRIPPHPRNWPLGLGPGSPSLEQYALHPGAEAFPGHRTRPPRGSNPGRSEPRVVRPSCLRGPRARRRGELPASHWAPARRRQAVLHSWGASCRPPPARVQRRRPTSPSPPQRARGPRGKGPGARGGGGWKGQRGFLGVAFALTNQNVRCPGREVTEPQRLQPGPGAPPSLRPSPS